MKQSHILPSILGLVALPALLALRVPADTIQFAPSADSEIGMEFSNSFEFFLDDFSAEAMGQDVGAMIGDVEVSASINIEAAFTDTYLETSEGMPRSFTREFGDANITGEATGEAQGESDTQSFELESGLSGSLIQFTWDAEEEEFTPTFADDEEGDEDLLKGLIARADLGFMLPEGEVSEGDEWEIDSLQLAELLAPGGDLAYDTEDGGREDFDSGDEEMDDDTMAMFRSLMEGEVKGTYKGINDEGMAEIAVTLEIAGDRDFADLIAKAIQKGIESSGEDVPMDQIPDINAFQVELSLEGEGTLLWDTRAGHVASFSMSAETEIAINAEMSMSQQGQQMGGSAEIVLGGTAEISVEAN